MIFFRLIYALDILIFTTFGNKIKQPVDVAVTDSERTTESVRILWYTACTSRPPSMP